MRKITTKDLLTLWDRPDADPEASLRSLDVDSLEVVELIMEAEEEYEISLSSEVYNSAKSVSDVVAAINAELAKD